mgnify:FL=1
MNVLDDDKLSAGAKLAYETLFWYAWKDGRYPGDKQMAEDLSVSERSIRDHPPFCGPVTVRGLRSLFRCMGVGRA